MIVQSEFKPVSWLKNPHAQTIWGSIFRRITKLATRTERLELDDSDFLDLEWLEVPNILCKETPILLLLHGLEGSHESTYIKGVLNRARSLPFRTVVLNFRGCGSQMNRLAKSYHSGETDDLRYVIQVISERFPTAKIMVAGFSLGGNVLLKYLGEIDKQPKILAAMAVSVPMLLEKCSEKLDRGFSKIYRFRLMNELKRKTLIKMQQFPNALDVTKEQVKNFKSFFEFDDRVTAKLNGFSGALDYYQKCSSRQYLKSIQTPTLILHSKDDPFMTQQVIPTNSELSETVNLELTETGGHVGFISGKWPWSLNYFIEDRLQKWFLQALEQAGSSEESKQLLPTSREVA